MALSSDERAQLAIQFFENGFPLLEIPHLYKHLGKSTRLSLIEQLIQKEELTFHRSFLKAMVRDSECLEILHGVFLSNPLELYPLGGTTYGPFIEAVRERVDTY